MAPVRVYVIDQLTEAGWAVHSLLDDQGDARMVAKELSRDFRRVTARVSECLVNGGKRPEPLVLFRNGTEFRPRADTPQTMTENAHDENRATMALAAIEGGVY